jgi:predicted HTH transcriptional regulator
MDFYHDVYRVSGFYFGFKDDDRELLDTQSYSRIGRGRVVNVVRLDESGTSYKQYSKKGCFDCDHDNVIDDINFRLQKRQSPRNRRVAEILALCGLVERSGQGMNLIYELSIKEAHRWTRRDSNYQNSVCL